MNLLIDVLSARLGGGLSFATRQINGLASARPEWNLTALASRANANAFASVPGLRIESKATNWVGGRLLFEQVFLPARLKRFDVVYCPGNFVPLLTGVPSVVAQQNPNYFGTGRTLAARRGGRLYAEIALARLSISRARAVIVISETLRAEMERDGIWSAKCHVVRSGGEVPTDELSTRQVSESKPFFLSVANDYPHKRLDDLIRAWSQMPGSEVPQLVMVGQFSEARRAHQRMLAGPHRQNYLLHLGEVTTPGTVRWLMTQALALVITSELEAFPLTPMEAGAVGCPLILTDIPAHREVTGRHGTFYAPRDIRQLSTHLLAATRQSLPREHWSWPTTWREHGEQLAKVIESVGN